MREYGADPDGLGPDARDRGTVLVAADDSWLQAFISDVLAGEGYRVLHSRNGVDGLPLAREHRPHVIILDLGLPKKRGLELLQELKTLPATCTIPVIVMSDSVRPMLAHVAGRAELVLQKPLEFARLVAYVKRLMARVGRCGHARVGAVHGRRSTTASRRSADAP
jgi:DNA-binding response OmpR family regulator